MHLVEMEGLTLPEMRAKLKAARLEVRRHNRMLKLLDTKPEWFLNTNGRQLIRDWLYSASMVVKKLETEIVLVERRNGTPARRQG